MDSTQQLLKLKAPKGGKSLENVKEEVDEDDEERVRAPSTKEMRGEPLVGGSYLDKDPFKAKTVETSIPALQ